MSFTKFREHRGGLAESMATVVDIDNYHDLLEYVRKLLDPWYTPVPSLKIQPYYDDPRIGWSMQSIVTLPGYGVVGFINGVVDDIPE